MTILPALLVGSGLKRVLFHFGMTLTRNSPGFIGREWIETPVATGKQDHVIILPALLVGSGLKLSLKREVAGLRMILPALLVGSGLKPALCVALNYSTYDSPGFIGREWIET